MGKQGGREHGWGRKESRGGGARGCRIDGRVGREEEGRSTLEGGAEGGGKETAARQNIEFNRYHKQSHYRQLTCSRVNKRFRFAGLCNYMIFWF